MKADITLDHILDITVFAKFNLTVIDNGVFKGVPIAMFPKGPIIVDSQLKLHYLYPVEGTLDDLLIFKLAHDVLEFEIVD